MDLHAQYCYTTIVQWLLFFSFVYPLWFPHLFLASVDIDHGFCPDNAEDAYLCFNHLTVYKAREPFNHQTVYKARDNSWSHLLLPLLGLEDKPACDTQDALLSTNEVYDSLSSCTSLFLLNDERGMQIAFGSNRKKTMEHFLPYWLLTPAIELSNVFKGLPGK